VKHKRRAKFNRGFTIIEVLASMAVLVLIMLGMARIFPQASKAFQTGVEIADRNAAMQAALDMIIRDIENLVVDNRFGFFKDADVMGGNYDEFYFVSTSESDNKSGRDYLQMRYYVTGDTNTTEIGSYATAILKRWTREFNSSRGGDPMATNDFWNHSLVGSYTGEGAELLRNVVRFDVYVAGYEAIAHPTSTNLVTNGDDFDWFDRGANTNQPPKEPHFIDIYLQVASDAAMKKYSLLKSTGQDTLANDLVNRDSSVLVTRIYPTQMSHEYLLPSDL